MAHFEIDCRKCVNCYGYRCKIYGEDPNIAVEKCANDIFKHYIDISDTKSKTNKIDNVEYNTLTIEMTDGSTSTYKDGQWDDWDIIGDFLVVLDKDSKWIGMRNKNLIKKVDMYHE